MSELPESLLKRRKTFLQAGLGGLALWLLIALVAPGSAKTAAMDGYLIAFLFWLGVSLGSLAILMLHNLVGGAWGFLLKRPLEAGVWMTILCAVLFIPIAVGVGSLYPWADPNVVAHDPALKYKVDNYLNPAFFYLRAALYFAVWIGLAFLLNKLGSAQDKTEDPRPSKFLQQASAGLVIYAFTVSFAAIDWVMSLEPEWYSTIYGAMIFIGMALSAFAFMAIFAAILVDREELAEVTGPEQFHDVGNLMLAFVMLWAYMSFSQFLIIWSGNTAEEIPWYLRRSVGVWRWVAIALMAFHFFLPFFFLLFRETKRKSFRLWKVALCILVMHLVDLLWLVFPSSAAGSSWGVIAVVPAFVGVGGVWLYLFVGRLASRPLLPKNDPLLEEALHHEHAGAH